MKIKLLSVLLAFALCLSFSACAESAAENDINNSDNTENSSTGLSETAAPITSDTPAQTVTAEEDETKPTDEPAVLPADTTNIETALTAAQTEPPQTAAAVPAVTEPLAPQWSESAVSGVMYVNTNGVYSRVNAIQGSARVKSYGLNQAVSVIAKTDTGYYKIGDGEYIHGDFLGTSRITSAAVTTPKPAATTAVTQKPPAVTAVTTAPSQSGEAPNYGQRKQTQEEISFANKVFDLINAERTKNNLAPFKKLDAITEIANVRAWELSVSFGHSRPDGSSAADLLYGMGLNYSHIGENIAAGQATPEEVVEAWMNSAPHRKNILSEDYIYMGIGFYNIPGSLYTTHWTQIFYSPL